MREQESMEEYRKQMRYPEEFETEEIKLKMKRKYEKDNKKEHSRIQVKLPKLMISKFEGTHLNWQRFWSQFENKIDQSEISQVSKFS